MTEQHIKLLGMYCAKDDAMELLNAPFYYGERDWNLTLASDRYTMISVHGRHPIFPHTVRQSLPSIEDIFNGWITRYPLPIIKLEDLQKALDAFAKATPVMTDCTKCDESGLDGRGKLCKKCEGSGEIATGEYTYSDNARVQIGVCRINPIYIERLVSTMQILGAHTAEIRKQTTPDGHTVFQVADGVHVVLMPMSRQESDEVSSVYVFDPLDGKVLL